jgi:hypothetical protein
MKQFSFALGLLILISTAGCMPMSSQSLPESQDGFTACTPDPRILCEPGSEELANAAVGELPRAIQQVTTAQLTPFAKPVVIYTYASRKSFTAQTGMDYPIIGVTVHGVVHLSPKLLEQPQRVPAILTHELSHLHLQQLLGNKTWGRNIPVWFHEGLAVLSSGGGGAERVSIAEAEASIRNGKRFVPNISGSLFNYKGAAFFGLEQHMFYRQASLFIHYLQVSDPSAYRALLTSLESSLKFEEAFAVAYHRPLLNVWDDFVSSVQSGSFN